VFLQFFSCEFQVFQVEFSNSRWIPGFPGVLTTMTNHQYSSPKTNLKPPGKLAIEGKILCGRKIRPESETKIPLLVIKKVKQN